MTAASHFNFPGTEGMSDASFLNWTVEQGILGRVFQGLPTDQPALEPIRREMAQKLAMLELGNTHRDQVYRDAILHLEAAGIRVIVLKGRAWAHQYYDVPADRTSGDLDIWIDPAQLDACIHHLGELGYTAGPKTSGVYMPTQVPMRDRRYGTPLEIDLQWACNSRRAVAATFDHADEWRIGTRLAGHGFAGVGMRFDSSLLLACCHYGCHIPGTRRMIWLVDILRLLRMAPDGGLATFVERAIRSRHSRVCAEAIRLALALDPTVGPPAELTPLFEHADTKPTERSATYLDPDRTAIKDLVIEWRSYDRLSDRIRMLYLHLVPRPVGLRQLYGDDTFLPWSYARYFGSKAKHRLLRKR